MLVDDEEVLFESREREGARLRICASPRGARIELAVCREQLEKHRQTLRMLVMMKGAQIPEVAEAFEKLEKYLDQPAPEKH